MLRNTENKSIKKLITRQNVLEISFFENFQKIKQSEDFDVLTVDVYWSRFTILTLSVTCLKHISEESSLHKIIL